MTDDEIGGGEKVQQATSLSERLKRELKLTTKDELILTDWMNHPNIG